MEWRGNWKVVGRVQSYKQQCKSRAKDVCNGGEGRTYLNRNCVKRQQTEKKKKKRQATSMYTNIGLLDVEFASQVDMDLWPLHTSVHLIRVYICVHFHGYV